MAYDAARQSIVLYGGSGNAGDLGDTWTLDASGWLQAPGTNPSPRSYPSMVYDEARQKIVLVGGDQNGLSTAETWELSSSGWTQAASAPAALNSAMAAFDGTTNLTAVFGGNGPGGYLGTGAEFDGSWRAMAAPLPSPARIWGAMAFDSGRGKLVLYGGTGGTSALGDLWER